MRGQGRGSSARVDAKGRAQETDADVRGLVQRVKAGDQEAFGAIFHRYGNRVYHQVFSLLGNAAEAEEVVQEVFLAIYAKVRTFRGDSTFSTWLYRLTVNASLTRLRQRTRGEEVSIDDYLPQFQADGHHVVWPVVDWSQGLEERVAREEVRRLLQQALDQLGPVDKAVVVLSDLEEFSNREIGATLGLSIGAVKARLHRARLFLRGRLAVSLGHSPT